MERSSKNFFMAFFFLCFSLFIFQSDRVPDSTPEPSRQPSSLNFFPFAQNRCEAQFEKRRKVFDIDLFFESLKTLENSKGPTEEEIKDAMGNPEQFLAIVEYTGRQQDQSNRFSLVERISELSEKDLKKLHQAIFKKTKSGEISEYSLENLLVKIYRITNRPKGVIRTLVTTRSFQETFDRISDQKILERIYTSLYKKGMVETFDDIVRDPNLLEKFKINLKKYGPWIDLTLAGGFWLSALILDPVTTASFTGLSSLIPPYLPSFSQFFRTGVTTGLLEQIKKEGLDRSFDDVKKELKIPTRQQETWDFSRKVYTSVFTAVFAITTVNGMVEAARLRHDQDAAQVQKDMDWMEKRIELSKQPLEVQAEKDYQEYIDFLRSKGRVVDESSPEVQADKRKWVDNYIKTHQKQNPGP